MLVLRMCRSRCFGWFNTWVVSVEECYLARRPYFGLGFLEFVAGGDVPPS